VHILPPYAKPLPLFYPRVCTQLLSLFPVWTFRTLRLLKQRLRCPLAFMGMSLTCPRLYACGQGCSRLAVGGFEILHPFLARARPDSSCTSAYIMLYVIKDCFGWLISLTTHLDVTIPPPCCLLVSSAVYACPALSTLHAIVLDKAFMNYDCVDVAPMRRVDYVLTVCTQGDEFLTVELEQEFNAFRWRGDFTAECTYPHTCHSHSDISASLCCLVV
jgi:hypothetical protein